MWRPVNDQDERAHPDFGRHRKRTAFAVLERDQLVALARAMPDAQSAVLLCLVWQAALQVKLNFGPNAGRAVARLSGAELSEMTGCPLRTVRYALGKLKRAAVIFREPSAAGRKSTYRLTFPPLCQQDALDSPK